MSESRGPFPDEAIDQAIDLVDGFIDETLNALAVDEDFTDEISFDGNRVAVELDGNEDDVALVIGKRGQTLDAIQFIANAIVIRTMDEPVPVWVEAQGYRGRREGQLEKQADRAVAQVVRSGDEVELDPMTSSERKVIHMLLRDNPDVETESRGREPHRKLVVVPAEDAD